MPTKPQRVRTKKATLSAFNTKRVALKTNPLKI